MGTIGEDHLKGLRQNLLVYQQEGFLTDTRLVTATGTVSAHKALLCAYLPPLKMMIDGHDPVFIIPGENVNTVQDALEEVYLNGNAGKLAELLNIKVAKVKKVRFDKKAKISSKEEQNRNSLADKTKENHDMNKSLGNETRIIYGRRRYHETTTFNCKKLKVHFGKPGHSCEICGTHFFKASYLLRHQERVHKIHTNKNLKRKHKKRRLLQRKAICVKCSMTFSSRNKFENHMKINHGSVESSVLKQLVNAISLGR